MAKKRKTNSKNRASLLLSIKGFFSNKSNHAIFGLLLLFLSLFLAGSIISYFINWRADQSDLTGGFFTLLSNPEYKVDNVLGKIGAALGHQLVYRGFGITSLLLAWFLLASGLKLLLQLKIVRLRKNLGAIVFLILWTPPFLAFVFPSYPQLSGSIGFFGKSWLISTSGSLGGASILFFGLLIFLAIRFKWTPEAIQNFFSKINPNKRDSAKAVPNEENSSDALDSLEVDEKLDEPLEVALEEPAAEVENFEPEVIEMVSEPTEDTITEPEIELESESDSDLEIEETEEEEELTDSELNKKVKDFGEYDPKLDLSRFKLPTIDLLKDYGQNNITINQEELEENKNKIVNTLNNYKIDIAKIKATIGPTVTLYEIIPAAGVRISKIKNLEDDIALSLSALGIRIIAPIPGKGTIGIEVPNTSPQMVPMRNMLKSEKFQESEMELPIAFGKTISNETFMADLARMPHLLMAGATGQGKSVGLNVILTSILYKKHPSQVKFVLVDPKKVELTLFNKIERHYLAKLPDTEEAIITDTNKVINTLNSLCIEMDDRYELLKNAMCRNIKEYNAKFIKRKLNPEEGHQYLPYIVLVIDEFADLIMTAGKEVETPIARLAQLARAIGIHLIIATQRPSVNVITGIIKANFPARIAFRVTSKIDSRTILDAGGADQLIGKGDMLFSSGNDLTRIQCAFVDTPEVEEITDYIGSQKAYPEAYQLPEYKGEEEGGSLDLDPSDRDALFEDAARVIVMHQQGSTSLLQRKLKLGYNRAGRIVDQLEAAGIIGPFEGSKARQVLIPDEMALEQLLKNEKENL